MTKLLPLLLILTLAGCITLKTDPAKYISRHCPVELMDREEDINLAVIEGPQWYGGNVRVIGECFYDAQAIQSWSESNNIPCTIRSVSAEEGFSSIPNGHWVVAPENSLYVVDYMRNVGIVYYKVEYARALKGNDMPCSITYPVPLLPFSKQALIKFKEDNEKAVNSVPLTNTVILHAYRVAVIILCVAALVWVILSSRKKTRKRK